MSFEPIAAFFKKVSENPELRGRVEAALEDREDAAAFEIVEIARELGHEFSATELRTFVAEGANPTTDDGELGLDELQAVAGGIRYQRIMNLSGIRKLRKLNIRKLETQGIRKLGGIRKQGSTDI